MTVFVETWDLGVAGTFGIQDRANPFEDGPRLTPEYHVWRQGVDIGAFATLEEARRLIVERAQAALLERGRYLWDQMEVCAEGWDRLGKMVKSTAIAGPLEEASELPNKH